jgi:hypothetical protein
MKTVKIIALYVAAAVAYGLVHDQITAHLCVEYFSVAHPKVIESDSPFLLALVWGVLATWWVGLILGIPLAAGARIGSWPKLEATHLRLPILVLLAVMAMCAGVAGLTAKAAAGDSLAYFAPELSRSIPLEKHQTFIGVWVAHTTSYATGFLGGMCLLIWTVLRRSKLRRHHTAPQSPRTATPALP